MAMCAVGCSAQGSGAAGADWPHWRGPERSDVTTESSGWDEGAWPLGTLWTRQVGAGATSPIVAEGHVYVMGWANDTDTVYCIDAAGGQDVWTQSYPCPRYGRHHKGDEGHYHGPSATPEYDADTGYLYTLSIDGDLNCWHARTGGARVWGSNLYAAYGVAQRPSVAGVLRDYGYTTSPLIHGNWLIVEVGDDEGNLMAFDSLTGRRRGASECKDPAGHTGGPVPMTVEGVRCVAVLTAHRLLVARLDAGHEGETVATLDWQTQGVANIPTPAVLGDSVIVSSGYNVSRTARIRVSLGGAIEVWQSRYSTRVCSPVIHKGHVYIAWHKLRCLDYETGELSWEGGRFGEDASMVGTGDDRIIVLGSGRLALVETAERSPGEYRELASVDGPGGSASWPHLAVANARVFAKDLEGNLLCFTLADGPRDVADNRPPGPPPGPLTVCSFAAEDAQPDWGGDWGLWPQVEGCGGETTWIAEDAEGGTGGSMRIDYAIAADPRSFSMWFAPGRNVSLSGHDRFVIWAKGTAPSFTLVVKDRNSDPEGETDAGIADCLVTGVGEEWRRFELPFAGFRPRERGGHIDWGAIDHVGVAMIDGINAPAGSLHVDNLRAIPVE